MAGVDHRYAGCASGTGAIRPSLRAQPHVRGALALEVRRRARRRHRRMEPMARSAPTTAAWRAAWWQGKPLQAVQITDVMVSPRDRGILRRDGAFALAAASFPECFTGYGAKALIGFGFPSERHFRAAALRRLYAEVDRIREMTWQCDHTLLARAAMARRHQIGAAER